MSRAVLLLFVLVGFAARLHGIDAVPLRWDEGWSIALARLPVSEMFRLTALDVHPPLYYLLLKPWLLSHSGPELWNRVPSALIGTLAIPLAAIAALSWWRPAGASARRAALCAAACASVAPPFLYYGGVTRMYAVTAPLLLMSLIGLARCAAGGRRRWAVVAIVGAAGALHTFYYTGFALAGLFGAALLVWPQRVRRIVAVAVVTAALFVPWAAYAGPRMLARTGERTAGGLDIGAVGRLLDDGLFAATFAHDAGGGAMLAIGMVFAVGAAAARPRLLIRLGVVLLTVLGTLVGAAFGAQAHMFAPRYVIGATPFLVLGVGWALSGLWSRSAALAAAGAIALAVAVTPTIRTEVYGRSSEVTEAYDPAADAVAMSSHAGPDDLMAFNVLSLAGAYERHRGPDAPAWTYAQVWDPVREPEDLAVRRVADAVVGHPRLWLVLYRGTASPGSEALKRWADAALFPSDGWWTDDRLYQSYVVAGTDRDVRPDAVFGDGTGDGIAGGSGEGGVSGNGERGDRETGSGEGVDREIGSGESGDSDSGDIGANEVGDIGANEVGVSGSGEGGVSGSGEGGVSGNGKAAEAFAGLAVLESASFTSVLRPGSGVGVELVWTGSGRPSMEGKVFAHLYDNDGQLVAQHDAFAANDTRPRSTWQPGERVRDRHGLMPPADATGPFTLVVGLYDPTTGRRWRLADGSDTLKLGMAVRREP